MAENDLMTPTQADALVSSELPTNHAHQTQNVNHRTALRTVLRAVTSCYGGMHFLNLASPKLLDIVAFEYTPVTGWTAAMAGDTLTVSTTNGTITIPSTAAAGDFEVHCTCSVQRKNMPTTTLVFLRLEKNGTEVTTHIVDITADELAECMSFVYTLPLVSGDVLRISFSLAETATNAVGVNSAQFFAKRIGD